MASSAFYTTVHGKYYHKNENCGRGIYSLKNKVSLNQLGKQPCPKCIKKAKRSVSMKSTKTSKHADRKKLEAVIQYRSTKEYRWSVLKTSAKKRGLSIQITEKYVLKLMQEACIYCGRVAKNISHSLDRLDNSIGYTTDNVVTCCSQCNHMKWTWNVLDFIRACKNVTYPDTAKYDRFEKNKDHHATSYVGYRKSAERKNYSFSIDEKQFDSIRMRPCYYCKREASDKYPMGLDRKINSRGYTISNVVPCCSRCNRMKADYTEKFFREMCKKISEKWGHILENHNSSSSLKEQMVRVRSPIVYNV